MRFYTILQKTKINFFLLKTLKGPFFYVSLLQISK